MCLAVPMRVVALTPPLGVVELEGVRREVHLGFLEEVEVGDYVLIHAGCAVERLEPERAREDLELLRSVLRASDEAAGAEGGTFPHADADGRPIESEGQGPPGAAAEGS